MIKRLALAVPCSAGFVWLVLLLGGCGVRVWAQQATPVFTPGNLVVLVEGCGVNGGTCTAVPNGTGTGAGNSSAGGYGDNQAAPVTLFQYAPTGTGSVAFVNSVVLPQTGSGANLPISGEYGSSSEGGLQLSGTGQYLTLGTYGINAAVFNASAAAQVNTYGAAPSYALAQTGSLTGQSYTPVARVVTLVDPYGNVNSATGVFNIYNTNNPRSVYSATGATAYLSGQGSGSDATGGVFYTAVGAVNNAPTAITGLDTSANTLSQDSRFVTVYNNTLYVSVDSKQGSNNARSFVGTLGTPPATTLYSNNAGPTQLPETSNGTTTALPKTGAITLTASETNGVNSTGLNVNLSPSGYYFANAATMYIADSGNGKQTSGSSKLGAGGLQKWVNTAADGSGTWVLQYTLYKGLNLIANTTAVPANTSGTSGLYAVTGVVSGANVSLYVTNSTLSDLDATYLYGITDTLAATTNPNVNNTFTLLATAPADSNFKGVSFAPTLPAGSATINTVPQGLQVTTAGTGCAPGTYVTPVTLTWTPGNSCQLSVVSPQTANGSSYVLYQWQDGTAGTTDTVTAPAASAVYTATFVQKKLVFTAAPAATVAAGGNAGSVQVSLESTANSVLTGDSSTVVTLKVAGPGGYAQTYTATASAGVATFNLGSATLTTAGTYSYTATAASVAQAAATEAVSAGQAVSLVVSGPGTFTAPQQTGTVVVTAADSYGNAATGFTGTVTLASTDATAVFTPASYAYASSDAGVHSFIEMFNTAGTYAVTAAATGLAGSQTGIVVQDSLLVLNANGTVVRATNAGASTNNFGSANGTSVAGGVSTDGAGNLWVVENANSSVQEYSRTGVAVTVNGSSAAGVAMPQAVVVDGLGNVWVANGNSSVSELTNAGAAMSPATGYTGVTGASSGGTNVYATPAGIAVDVSGNVWVTNAGSNSVVEILGAAASLAPLATAVTNNALGVRP